MSEKTNTDNEGKANGNPKLDCLVQRGFLFQLGRDLWEVEYPHDHSEGKWWCKNLDNEGEHWPYSEKHILKNKWGWSNANAQPPCG